MTHWRTAHTIRDLDKSALVRIALAIGFCAGFAFGIMVASI